MSDLQRLEEIFQSEIFETLFKIKPQMKSDWKLRIFPVAGDLTLSGLGLSPESR
jgi:thioester reductase-like protein